MKIKNYTPQQILEHAKKHSAYFYFPIVKAKRLQEFIPDITYKKIYSWERKHLITIARYKVKGKGWRAFSIIDILKLRTIADLKRLGMRITAIKEVLDEIFEMKLPVKKLSTIYREKNRDFLTAEDLKDTDMQIDIKDFVNTIEYHIYASFLGQKTLLVTYNVDGNRSRLMSEKEAIEAIFTPQYGAYPFQSLPFYSYIQQIAKAVDMRVILEEDTTAIKRMIDLTPKEKKILALYRDNRYKEINITKRNGEETILRPKIHRQGDFSDKELLEIVNQKEYQKVTVSQVGGKKISITNEEVIKV